MTHLYDRQYIDGAWCATQGRDFIKVADPNTGTIVAEVTTGHEEDARRAAPRRPPVLRSQIGARLHWMSACRLCANGPQRLPNANKPWCTR